jgi:phosphopantothenoylcysteine decarboxylase/phosphopantothenate--cysteine ligase
MTITLLDQKRILLGVTGSIAAYKSADLASKLTQAGALVDVILTDSAQQFITPLTFQALTGRPVYTDLWQGAQSGSGLPAHIAHVGLGEGADLLLIAPATANTLAKLANGLSDDLLSVTFLAARCPVLVAPAMDGGMYEHPATQANLERLAQYGVHIIEPEWGRFASGLEGRGRFPETATLVGQVRRILGQQTGALKGARVVVTAGGTREAIDPVRFISNHSSGKQGYALAQAALDAGAAVTLISTVGDHLPAPIGAHLVRVDSAQVLQTAVFEHLECDILIMAAAVADFRPAQVAEQKIKKGPSDQMTIELTKNADILALVGAQRGESGYPKVCIGFAAETQALLANAQEKLTRKNADMIVANDITAPGAGFGSATNIVTLLTRHAPPQALPIQDKTIVAEQIVHFAAKLLYNQES